MPRRIKGTGGTYMKTTDKQKQAMTSDDAYRLKAKSGGRASRKFGSPKNGEKSMNKKYKGFSKLPEKVQMKINKKLAKKV